MTDETPLALSPIRQSKQSTAKLYEALAKAQAEYPPIEKKHTAKVVKNGQLLYTFDYADLADIMTVIRPVLGRHGLCVMQFPLARKETATLWIVTRVAFKDGSWIEADYPAAPIGQGFNHQAVAGGVTFAKRYSYTAMTGVSAEEENEIADSDDGRDFDGDIVEQPKKQEPPKRSTPPRSKPTAEEPAPRREPQAQPEKAPSEAKHLPRDPLMRAMYDQSTVESLTLWHKNHVDEIRAKKQDYQDEFYARYDARLGDLKGEPSLMGG